MTRLHRDLISIAIASAAMAAIAINANARAKVYRCEKIKGLMALHDLCVTLTELHDLRVKLAETAMRSASIPIAGLIELPPDCH